MGAFYHDDARLAAARRLYLFFDAARRAAVLCDEPARAGETDHLFVHKQAEGALHRDDVAAVKAALGTFFYHFRVRQHPREEARALAHAGKGLQLLAAGRQQHVAGRPLKEAGRLLRALHADYVAVGDGLPPLYAHERRIRGGAGGADIFTRLARVRVRRVDDAGDVGVFDKFFHLRRVHAADGHLGIFRSAHQLRAVGGGDGINER